MKPYTFQPVYPVNEGIDLGTRIVGGTVTLVEFKDACGIAGCIIEKHDAEEVAAALELAEDLSGASLEELAERLRSLPATADAAFDLGLWLPIIMQIIRLILDRIGGGSSSPVPGPV